MGNSERLTLEEAAKYLRKSPSWLYRNRERLSIKGYKIGGCWQFYKDDLDTYIESTASGFGSYTRPSRTTGNTVVLVAS
jgi:excisionase family DNA binding protein